MAIMNIDISSNYINSICIEILWLQRKLWYDFLAIWSFEAHYPSLMQSVWAQIIISCNAFYFKLRWSFLSTQTFKCRNTEGQIKQWKLIYQNISRWFKPSIIPLEHTSQIVLSSLTMMQTERTSIFMLVWCDEILKHKEKIWWVSDYYSIIAQMF